MRLVLKGGKGEGVGVGGRLSVGEGGGGSRGHGWNCVSVKGCGIAKGGAGVCVEDSSRLWGEKETRGNGDEREGRKGNRGEGEEEYERKREGREEKANRRKES